MPEIIETTVYRLDELSDAAKEKARAWYSEGGFDYDWFECVYDDFERIAEILGLRLKTRVVRLFGGGTRQKPSIWFSGFSCQGDGACYAAGAIMRSTYVKFVKSNKVSSALLCITRSD
jgi:hypothetical protein